MKTRGRKSKLTKRTIEIICAGTRSCCFTKSLLSQLGISEQAFYKWIKEGEADIREGRKTLKAELVESRTRARACAEEELIASISLAAGVGESRKGGDWRAAAYLLERLFPEQFSPRWMRMKERLQQSNKNVLELPAPSVQIIHVNQNATSPAEPLEESDSLTA